MQEWLYDKNLDYFAEKYSDNYITNQMVFGVLNEDITLTDLDEEKQYTYTYFLYKYILYKIYGDKGTCLLYTSPSPRDGLLSRMPSSA